MRRRPHVRYSSLTSLLDVLFILLFASLARAAGVIERFSERAPAPSEAAAAGTPTPGAPADVPAAVTVDAGAPAAAQLRSRLELRSEALRALALRLEQKSALFVRISRSGEIVGIDLDTRATSRDQQIGVPLLERVDDPDIALSYLGDGTESLRVCSVIARHLAVSGLADKLVVFAPELPLAELPTALVMGLRRDEERCLRDTGGVAVIIEPVSFTATPTDEVKR